MTSTPQRPHLGGVDFTNVHRAALYATPTSPRTPASTKSKSHVRTAAPSLASPAGMSTTTASFAFSRSDGGNVGNSSRKRTRGTPHSYSSKIPTSAGKRSSYVNGSVNASANAPMHGYAYTPPAHRSMMARGSTSRTWSSEQQQHDESELALKEKDMSYETGYATPGTVTPPPLANSRYYLANGHDTPTAVQANAYEEGALCSNGSQSRFKRLADEGVGRHAYAFTAGLEGSAAEEMAGPLAMARNDNRRLRSRATSSAQASNLERSQIYGSSTHSQSGDPATWGVGKALLGAAAGVAGFVFHFCTAGAFRGFHAGEGQAWSADGKQCLPTNRGMTPHGNLATDPAWQDSDFAQDDLPFSPSPPRPAKKVKSSYEDGGGLKSSWIMVDAGDEGSISGTPRDGTSSRRSLGTTTASPAGLRQRAKPGTHKRRFGSSLSGSVVVVDGRAASSAALRSPVGRDSGSRPGSVARPRSNTEGAVDSPLGKEDEKLIKQQRRRVREEDRELANMNRRLEEMIRQGREALGTRYEVEMDDEIF